METKLTGRYLEGVGRRKTAIARVRIRPAAKTNIVVNNRELANYFKTKELQHVVFEALEIAAILEKFSITVKVNGGGTNAQAEAIRHALARALLLYEIGLRKVLKAAGYLTRDPRAKERRKFGLKKARRAPQWSKR